jgi:quercetin dioxygenase-like cupin family protein
MTEENMKTGEMIENPVIKQQLILCAAPEETGGRSVVVEYTYEPFAGNKGQLGHIHRYYHERFDILSGIGHYQIAGEEKTAHAGESFEVPVGTSHIHPWNEDGEVLRIRQTTKSLQPDLQGLNTAITAVETIAGLAREGKVNANGQPNLLQGAVVLNSLMPGSYSAGIPYPVQRVLLGLLAGIGRLFGYRASYPRFSSDLAMNKVG